MRAIKQPKTTPQRTPLALLINSEPASYRERASRRGLVLIFSFILILLFLALFVYIGWFIHRASHGPDSSIFKGRNSPKSTGNIGSQVRDGQFEFVVNNLTCGQDSIIVDKTVREATGQFCVLELAVHNIGNQPRLFSSSPQKLHLNSGEIAYPTDGIAAPDTEDVESLPKMIHAEYRIDIRLVFDIPTDAAVGTIELHDSPLSHGAKVLL